MILLLLGIGFVGIAVVLLATAATAKPFGGDVVSNIAAYSLTPPQVETQPERRVLTEAINGAAATLGRLLNSRVPWFREESARKALMAAGMYRTDPRRFMGYRVLAGVAAPIVWVVLGPNPSSPVVVPVGAIVAAVLGFLLPLLVVKRRGRTRLERIEYELPELVDLLVVTLEGGVSFSGSMQMASERVEGPLGDELRLALQEQRMGLAVSDSLRNMMERAETPSMRSFVRSILQGEQLGVSTGQIMRNLAGEMRKRRRAAAEERAQKAPVKLLFPLIFLIFPAMFVILLGPAAFRFAESFPD